MQAVPTHLLYLADGQSKEKKRLRLLSIKRQAKYQHTGLPKESIEAIGPHAHKLLVMSDGGTGCSCSCMLI